MSRIDQRLKALGLSLPAPLQLPPGVVLPFPWVRVIGTRALISGHGPTHADGSLAQPLGKVGREVTLEQAYAAARLTGLAILGSLKRELGDLDRIAGWSRVFGAEKGVHARSAVGLAELPFNIPVEVEGEVELLAR
jgi:hypothetical protein